MEKRAYKRGRTLGGDDGGKNGRHISQSNVFIQSIQSTDQKNFVNSVWSPKTNQTDYSEHCYATVPRMSCERYFYLHRCHLDLAPHLTLRHGRRVFGVWKYTAGQAFNSGIDQFYLDLQNTALFLVHIR